MRRQSAIVILSAATLAALLGQTEATAYLIGLGSLLTPTD